MKATRRTVISWLLAAAICPPRLEIPKTLKELHAIRHAAALEGAFCNYREKALALFPDVPSQFITHILPNLKKRPGVELTFEWRLPND